MVPPAFKIGVELKSRWMRSGKQGGEPPAAHSETRVIKTRTDTRAAAKGSHKKKNMQMVQGVYTVERNILRDTSGRHLFRGLTSQNADGHLQHESASEPRPWHDRLDLPRG